MTIHYGAEKLRFACRITKARTQKAKVNVKFNLEQDTKVHKGSKGITSSLTSAREGGVWSTSRSGRFTRGKYLAFIVKEAEEQRNTLIVSCFHRAFLKSITYLPTNALNCIKLRRLKSTCINILKDN